MEPTDTTIPFLTTVIGSLPKPAWLYGSTAFSSRGRDILGEGASSALRGKGLKDAQDDAVKVAVHDQELAGIDIIFDNMVKFIAVRVLRFVEFKAGFKDDRTIIRLSVLLPVVFAT